MTVLSDRVDALEATNANLVTLLSGLQSTLQAAADAGQGPQGWSPVLALEEDGLRRVLKVTDWTGGDAGTTKPSLTGYVGLTGIVANVADGIDIRGAEGPINQGLPINGEILWPVADPLPSGFIDTGDRLLSGAAERAILAFDPPFTPLLSLFADNENGAWYDPSDLTTLFQDSAGTTPVTAAGDPVGYMGDKSGNGNHATQATSAARPTLQQDAGGRYYLDFDGVDDFLSVASFAVSQPMLIACGIDVTDNDANQYIVDSNTSADRVLQRVRAASGSVPGFEVFAGSALRVSSAVAQEKQVTELAIDGASSELLVNGSNVLTGNLGLNDYSSLRIGARYTNAEYFSGALYGIVIAENAVPSDNLRGFLATKTGVTL